MRAMRLSFLMFVGILLASPTTASHARTWTSATGDYSLEAEAIAFNDHTVILKRERGKLVAVELAELSEPDQKYVKSKELADGLSQSIDKLQTWTSKDGVKIRGRVLGYGRKDLVVGRRLGKVVANGEPFDKIDMLHQRLLLKILSELEGHAFTTEHELTQWATKLGAESKNYPLEGVLMELESGDQLPIPFFLFGEKELKVLQPGWEAWTKSNDDKASRQRESLMMQTEARQYQQQQAQRQQIEILKLNMLAARTGLTSIWEVGLEPAPGVYGRRITVLVTARDSNQASQIAMQQYPGSRVFGIRRASR